MSDDERFLSDLLDALIDLQRHPLRSRGRVRHRSGDLITQLRPRYGNDAGRVLAMVNDEALRIVREERAATARAA